MSIPGRSAPRRPDNPGGNVLAKVTVWPALNQRIDLSHNHAEGTSTRGFGAVEFASHGGSEPSTFDASRATWTVAGGRTSNELTLARVAATQQCLAGAAFPEIDVQVGDNPDVQIKAGAVNGCPNRFADQTTWELTDNLLRVTGAHHLTLGTHAENIHLGGSRRVRVPAGRWNFSSLDALEEGLPFLYVRDFAAPDRPEGSISDVHRATGRPLSAGPMGARARVRPHRRTPVRRALPPSRAPAESDTVFQPRRQHAGDTQRQRAVVAQGRLQLGCRKPGDDVPARRGGPVLRTAHVPLLQ